MENSIKVPGLVTTENGAEYEAVEVGVTEDEFGESFMMKTKRETVLLPIEPIKAVANGDKE